MNMNPPATDSKFGAAEVQPTKKALSVRWTRIWILLKKTLNDFNDDNCMQVAAASSYYMLFSLPATMTIVFAVAGTVFEPADVRGRVANEIRVLLCFISARRAHDFMQQAGVRGSEVGS